MNAWAHWRSRAKARLRAVPGFGFARLAWHILRGGSYRSTALLQWRRPRGLFQPYATTSADRYPLLFGLARDRLGDGPGLRILSFGCATGEEVWSLRTYFPTAEIVGLDINPSNIAACRRRLRQAPDPRLRFQLAGSAAAEPAGSFDAVFAMAVFRHGALNTEPPPPSCEPYLRFSEFAAASGDLCRCLKPGGLLIIRHAHFRFADTEETGQFDEILVSVGSSAGPQYGRDNRLLPLSCFEGSVYMKKRRDA